MNKMILPWWVKLIIAVACVFIGIVIGAYIYKFGGYGSLGSQEQFGQFGDYLGGSLNPLLSFITVVLLVWSISVQIGELHASQETLRKTHDVHKGQSELSEKQYIRNQLQDDAKMYLDRIEHLMQLPIFRLKLISPEPEYLCVNDLFKNTRYFGDPKVAELIKKIPEYMKAGGPEGLLLHKIKTTITFAVSSICPLIAELRVKTLRASWVYRAKEIIPDCQSVMILTPEEAQELKDSLLGAEIMADKI